MNRREVVKLGVIGLCGCGGGGDSAPPDAFDGGGVSMCGADLCLDLTHPANAALANVDGARAVATTEDKMLVVRAVATPPAFTVLSRICTHNGCTVGWDPSVHQYKCPCHGSRFADDGSVLRGPATRSLKEYVSTFDEATQTLTITLG